VDLAEYGGALEEVVKRLIAVPLIGMVDKIVQREPPFDACGVQVEGKELWGRGLG